MNQSDLIYRVETLNGAPLTEEETAEIQGWELGSALSQLVESPGWPVALKMLSDYANKAMDDLLRLAPGDPAVPQAHAAASALRGLYTNFIHDVDAAVQNTGKAPQALSRAYRRHVSGPVTQL